MIDAYKNICHRLNRHKVEYLVIGGVAVIAHGYPRGTGDVDFWYRPTTENYVKLIGAFKELGVDVSDLEKVVFDPKKSFIRIPTLGIKAEFLPQIRGVTKFEDAFKRAKMFNLEGISIAVIGYNDLIKNKKETKRPKDLGDVDELEKRRKASRTD
jgi:predicted nucleotidyltransferase